MYLRLAMRNVKKSYHDFLIYFMTLMFSVCLFYTFNSFQAQQEMMVLDDSKNTILMTVSLFMGVLSVFVIILLAFLMLYANNFLIRRRKKEFGLYMLMGMPDCQISKILIYETALIGLVSLVMGLGLGVAISQIVGVVTAQLFSVSVNFKFVFSPMTALMTILVFSLIFFVLMILNARIMRKQRLIDLLSASKKQEKERLHHLGISVILFLISLVCLGTTYYLATSSLVTFANLLLIILVLGAVGTILFFFSLCGFLLRFMKTSKRIYLRNLNMFVLRQIHARINTNFLSMSAVCLMLLLAIGALSTGWNLNTGLSKNYEIATPFTMSLHVQDAQREGIDQLSYDDTQVMSQQLYQFYSADITLKDLYPYLDQNEEMVQSFAYDLPLSVMRVSDYQAFCAYQGVPAKTIDENEYLMYSSIENAYDMIQDLKIPLTLYGKPLHAADTAIFMMPYNEHMADISAALTVPDEVLPQSLEPNHLVWNVKLKEDSFQTAFQAHIDEQLSNLELSWQTITKQEVYDNVVILGVLFTYIGLYLGIVFLMASAVILALQQLSEADENRQRYEILRKIGVEQRMMNYAIFLQIAIYFLLPLLLAIVHSYYGIQAVGGSFALVFGISDMIASSRLSGGVIILIYGTYFLLTVQGYKRILFQNR